MQELQQDIMQRVRVTCENLIGRDIHDASKHVDNTQYLKRTFDVWCDTASKESAPKRRQIASHVFSRCFKESWDASANAFTATPIKVDEGTFSDPTTCPAGAEVAHETDCDSMPLELQGARQEVPPPAGTLPPPGIRNQKNCCFMIAVLQLFHGIPAFRKAIFKVNESFRKKIPV